MRFDDALDTIGGFGKYQKIQFLVASVPAALIALHQLASVFLAATPDFSCDTNHTAYSNYTFAPYNSTAKDAACTAPFHLDTRNGTQQYEFIKCEHFIYSKEYFKETIVTEWNLVCGEKIKSTASTMVYMAGKLAGAFAFGLLSDVLGRKKTCLLAMLLLGCSGLGAAFSPNYYVFVVLRFIIGGCATGMYMCLFVLGMELIGANYRVLAGIAICYFFALGYVILAGVAYLSKYWVYTQISISAPAFLFLCYYWIMPESARWLISRNRTSEAMAIVSHGARVNGVTLPANFSLEQETTPTVSLRELGKSKALMCRTLIILLNWFAVSLGYYGLSLNSGTLKGSIYFNFMLSGAVEFVSYSACFTINKLGRKGPMVFSMLVAGLACVGTVLVDQLVRDVAEDMLNTYLVVLNIVGKFGMTMGFCIIYIWSAEIYPTSLRTTLMGMSSMMGRLGSILAPLISDLGQYVAKEYAIMLPATIFAVTVIISGLFCIALPETAGRQLPETVDDANSFTREKIRSNEVKGHTDKFNETRFADKEEFMDTKDTKA